MEGRTFVLLLHGRGLFTPSPRAGSRGWMPSTALRVCRVCAYVAFHVFSSDLIPHGNTWQGKFFPFLSMEVRLLFLNYGSVARLISSHKSARRRGQRDRARLSESCEWSPAARTTTMSHTHQRVCGGGQPRALLVANQALASEGREGS